ncbi:hypothetical protein BDN72DRAFT_112296 [Pluteus cervinus]|uniref:Uncharacterized protein n=1 Tax=Pluteus cervinus TaxID=181527 RepID=A0ACD3ANE3_9AGAR|nr:hypothetical protein BDN72DRAFT_112296 [Pluteus cervinus]
MSDEETYEVEKIVRAKVLEKEGRLFWRFLVRWKGYDADDDTWEAIDAFVGSGVEHVNEFFRRASANCGGRDWRNLDLFQVGEEFVLVSSVELTAVIGRYTTVVPVSRAM